MKSLVAATALLTLVTGGSAGADPAAVSRAEQAAWLNWLLPLPKRIAIERRVDVPAADVKLTLVGPVGTAGQSAAAELRALFHDQAGANCQGARFEILLMVCDAGGRAEHISVPGAAELARLPNSEQAYLIRPLDETRLALVARDERGLYYAAQTLRQLLESRFADGKVSIPLAQVTDWPDLAERGLWGGSANRDIAWMAASKMNLVESHVTLGMTADGHARAQADQEQIDLGRRHALKFVPVITHLNGLGRSGVYQAFPELQGQGARAQHAAEKSLLAPCCSQPKLIDVLAEWLIDLARQPGVNDICAWLSELERQYCDCPQCHASGVGQHALEARCLVKAYRIAQRKQPHFRLRILLTQGSYPANDQVLAEIPADVGVTYYDGGRTYDSSRAPMIYPLLEQYAAQGRWLGCYPQLTASWRIVCPWSGPQFIRARMNEFVDKKLQCLCGYATPDSRLYEFNILAAAEWSWNAKGRDERAFSAAWATRRGLQAEVAAQWAVTLGPIGWDVYGSRVPFSQFFGGAALSIARRKPLQPGEGLLRYFPSREHLDTDLAACDQALQLARTLAEPQLVAETTVIQGYLRMIQAINALATQISASKQLSTDRRGEVQKTLGRLCIAGVETNAALEQWEFLCSPGTPQRLGGVRLTDTLEATEKTVAQIARSLEPLGIRNLVGAYLREELGKWAAEDFAPQKQVTKTLDVTRYVTAPGSFLVGFTYTGGWNGLSIERVALVAAADVAAKERTELSVDQHHGSAAARNQANVYTVTLPQHNPAARYFIVAQIRGTPRQGRPPERQGCEGTIWIKGQRPDDWRTRLERATPLSDEELKRRRY